MMVSNKSIKQQKRRSSKASDSLARARRASAASSRISDKTIRKDQMKRARQQSNKAARNRKRSRSSEASKRSANRSGRIPTLSRAGAKSSQSSKRTSGRARAGTRSGSKRSLSRADAKTSQSLKRPSGRARTQSGSKRSLSRAGAKSSQSSKRTTGRARNQSGSKRSTSRSVSGRGRGQRAAGHSITAAGDTGAKTPAKGPSAGNRMGQNLQLGVCLLGWTCLVRILLHVLIVLVCTIELTTNTDLLVHWLRLLIQDAPLDAHTKQQLLRWYRASMLVPIAYCLFGLLLDAAVFAGAVCRSRLILAMYLVLDTFCTLLLVLLLVISGSVLVDSRSKHKEGDNSLIGRGVHSFAFALTDGKQHKVMSLLHEMQIHLQCCGLHTAHDYVSLSAYNTTHSGNKLHVEADWMLSEKGCAPCVQGSYSDTEACYVPLSCCNSKQSGCNQATVHADHSFTWKHWAKMVGRDQDKCSATHHSLRRLLLTASGQVHAKHPSMLHSVGCLQRVVDRVEHLLRVTALVCLCLFILGMIVSTAVYYLVGQLDTQLLHNNILGARTRTNQLSATQNNKQMGKNSKK